MSVKRFLVGKEFYMIGDYFLIRISWKIIFWKQAVSSRSKVFFLRKLTKKYYKLVLQLHKLMYFIK